VIRIAIVDDHALIRDGLRRALSRADDMQVTTEASTLAEARARLDHTDVDVLVVDIGLPDGSGLDLCREQRERNRDLGIVVLTMYAEDKFLLAAKDAGASTFIGKGAPSDDLVEAVRAAHQTPLPFAAEGLGDALLRASADEVPTLTSREREVLGLLAEGLGVAGVSRRLFISESTSKTHISKIYTKLGVSNRAQALMTALRLGLVEAPSDEQPLRNHPSG
jgi:DNA-binding NarL/FixJ family response regulator